MILAVVMEEVMCILSIHNHLAKKYVSWKMLLVTILQRLLRCFRDRGAKYSQSTQVRISCSDDGPQKVEVTMKTSDLAA